MTGVRWLARTSGAVVALTVLSLGGWTHQAEGPQYLDNSANGPQSAPPTATPTVTVSGELQANVTGQWISGAGGPKVADGSFERWRKSPVRIGGTWDNGNAEMLEMHSICPGGEWSKWRKPLDIAIGAIEKHNGESWAKAAKGAYDGRWTKALQKMKTCWGSRDPGLLYIRFAHEYNINDMPWRVQGGEEADFVKATIRFSNLRYKILPKAKIVLCPSDGTSGGIGIDLFKTWPGKDSQGRQVANIYAVDTYNSWVVIRTPEQFGAKLTAQQAGMPLGIETHRQMAEQWGVPFAISEWSNNGDPKDEGKGGDLPVYVQLMNEWFRANAGDPKRPQPGKLLYEIQFNDQDRFRFLPTKVQPKTAETYRKLVWGH